MPHEYIKHHTSEQHLTKDESRIETQTTSTLLAQAVDQEPNPRSTKKKKNSKRENIALAL